ncbi:MAG: DNA polymerase III subunit chi [Rhodospirillaceae bacterium]|jgi:DNA polymerase-3 subunit chi|nr:DNA polymerase III subunit chi [Rhodospirillaceae bacterium]MBT5459745.1 DNA polymerase III subunit chi [Rhodospirillaceae bacterium]
MTDIGFYHLTRTPLERALPKLLEKVLGAGKRAVIRAGSAERVAFLDSALWTYEQSSFLPHGTAQNGHAADQPIWLTAEDDGPNDPQILILTDGVTAADMEGFERCLEMFDGRDQVAVEAARSRWRDYTASGHNLAYWQQNERGGWEQKAGD